MKTFLIFFWIYAAMVANSFWEAYVEGRNPWDKRKLGWKLQITKKYCLPAYHFFLFFVMWPLLLTLPLIIYGWDFKLFGLLLSAYASGCVLEDFIWFIVNPQATLKDFNSSFVTHHPWLKIGKIEIPFLYLVGLLIAFLSWFFIWK